MLDCGNFEVFILKACAILRVFNVCVKRLDLMTVLRKNNAGIFGCGLKREGAFNTAVKPDAVYFNLFFKSLLLHFIPFNFLFKQATCKPGFVYVIALYTKITPIAIHLIKPLPV